MIKSEAEKDLKNANIAARNVLEDLRVEKSKVEVARAKEEAILLSIGDGIIATDEKGNIILINKKAEEILGKKSKEVMGKFFYDIVSIEDEKGLPISLEKRPINMALSEGVATTSGFAYYYVRKDETKFPVAITATPVMLDGNIIGTIEVFRDITREKEIDKAKSEFISIASHQLKTPPTMVKLLIERLLGGKMGEFTTKQKEYFNDIEISNQRMIDLVNSLLQVSRIELGAFTIQLHEKDACAVVESVIKELQSVIDMKRLKFKKTYSPKNIVIMLDESLFRMVINNLVINAIHYIEPEGGIEVSCNILNKGKEAGGKIMKEDCFLFTVTDTGYGIPAKDQSQLFTKFFRADNAREKQADGTGLGLYIVKSVLEHSGGAVWFTSKENKGSVFFVSIPMTGMKGSFGTKELVGR